MFWCFCNTQQVCCGCIMYWRWNTIPGTLYFNGAVCGSIGRDLILQGSSELLPRWSSGQGRSGWNYCFRRDLNGCCGCTT